MALRTILDFEANFQACQNINPQTINELPQNLLNAVYSFQIKHHLVGTT